MSDTVVLTEYLGMKTGQGAKGPWVLHKAKDSLGRNLSAFGNVGQLLYENVGKQVIVEGSARKPEYPNDITVTSIVATGEMAPAQAPAPAPVAYSPSMDDGKDRRISMLAMAKSFTENGEYTKAYLSAGTARLGPNEKWTPDKLTEYLADCAVAYADRVTNKVNRPVVGATAPASGYDDVDSIPF